MQAAQSQERALGGRLIDLTTGLAELQHRVYDDRPRETLEEVVPYPVAIDPITGSKPDPSLRQSAVLVDCDGRAANDLLTQRRSLSDDAPASTLAGAVEGADALVLVVDAGASPAQVDADLAEFVRFLRLFRRERGRRTDVGGLPVYLVLSKCDLLAQPTDDAAAWQARVQARQAEVGRRFREFLDEESADNSLAFGDLNLEFAATAVKWPALAGAPARPREPWGVADLFRNALAAAPRSTTAAASRSAGWRGPLSDRPCFLAAWHCLLPDCCSAARPSSGRNWRRRSMRTGLAKARRRRLRLTEPLQRKIGELSDLQNDPEFAQLRPESQKYVKDRLAELEAYRDYKERLTQVRSPAEARSLEDLTDLERTLRDELPLPAPYQTEWRQTDAAQLRDKWLDDVKARSESGR